MDLILERFTLAVGRVGPMTSPSSSLLMVFSTAVHKITTTEKQFNEFKNQLWYQSDCFHKKKLQFCFILVDSIVFTHEFNLKFKTR